jgi:plastocyanin
MRRNGAVLGAVLVSALLFSCGGGGGAATRTVLIDYEHDEFASAFNAYFPKNVTVHPGDTVRFKNTWSGEPHTVTMGTIVDNLFDKYIDIVNKYESEEDARAHEGNELVDKIIDNFARIPPLTSTGHNIFQPGAKPCFVTDAEDVPAFTDADDAPIPGAKCPTAGEPQPAFDGRHALYNSGFIPFEGEGANTFEVQVAEEAKPGTYNYFCTYHWTDMHGTVKVVPESQAIPSNTAVNRQGRKELEALAKPFLSAVRQAKAGRFGGVAPPIAGVPSPENGGYVFVDEFLPRKFEARVGDPVTWTVQGTSHTISFNVPTYFPVFTVAKNGDVLLDKRTDQAVGWTVPPSADVGDEEESPPRAVDVGRWDGGGGFHSSGLLDDGDTFTITFTKAGSYPYACVIHPPMIGTVVVRDT